MLSLLCRRRLVAAHALLGVLLSALFIGGSATPAGFSAFFEGAACPQGWEIIPTAQGRLVLSVSDAADAGVTVQTPLKDQEDRTHTHPYSTVFNLPSKSVAAIDCCNDQGACNGQYPINSQFNTSTSGLPFIQLLLCTLPQADSNPVPFGTIAFFESSVSSCPENFSSLVEANGRFILGGYASAGVEPSLATPLQSGEDRTHTHGYMAPLTTSDVSYVGASGCCNSNTAQDGTYIISGNSSGVSSGLPYIQLLTCVSTAPTFSEAFPAEMYLFNEVGCPPGWTAVYSSAGRFIVTLPENGVPGATFGGPSLEPGYIGDLNHTHPFAGAVQTNDCGVGLASGCCADGYAANKQYIYESVTDHAAVELPYLKAPMCAKTGSPRAARLAVHSQASQRVHNHKRIVKRPRVSFRA